jgi:1-acyl-sn-glycerol-3-phosphate acyltransferase
MLDRIDWCWRLAATGLCFLAFGMGGLLLRVLVFPMLSLAVRDPQARAQAARRVIHHTFRFFVGMMKGLGVLSYEAHGLERLNRPGLLILANHPSLIDVVFLISFTPRADCVVKAALLANPFTRGPVMAAGYIRNDGGPPMLNDCLASLKAGGHLIIFPEGTRSCPGHALKLQRGAANVAVRGRVPVTPVVITCDPATLTKGEPWWRMPSKRPHFRLEVRDDLPTETLIAGCANDALAARRLTDYLTDYFTSETRRDG